MPGVIALGRPKKKQSKADGPQKTLVSLKGNIEWADWLREYAESIGLPVTNAIDIALREQAKRDGFKRPMPRRF